MTEEHHERIAEQIERTNKLIVQLENQRYLQMVDQPWRFLGMSFLQGLAVALGSTLGFAVLFYLIVLGLRKLSVVTPLSDQINQILQLLNQLPKK